MDATSMRRRADPDAVAIWLLAFGLVAYLGLKGGGYDPLVHDQIGIVVWWLSLAGIAVGVLPRRRAHRHTWVAIGLLAALVAWTALSLAWTESTWRTSADLARLAGYLGVFALVALARVSSDTARLVGAVAGGIALVAIVGLLSRLHPAWFPEAGQTASFIADSRERLSYPINYWNGLAALVAIGLPLLLQAASDARSVLVRALAAATLPALALTIFLTLSRGGIAAATIALAIYLGLAADRLPKLLASIVAAAGSAVLIVAAASRDALQEGLRNGVAEQQGDDLMLIVLLVSALAGLAQAAISFALAEGRRPRWAFVARRQALAATLAGALLALLLAAALDIPGRAADGWDEFKRGGGPGSGTERLGSVAGQSRYELWQAALDENAERPLSGTGSGTFELWWARHGDTGESVRDTHSLYLQTLGELGIVGFLFLLAFLLAVFVLGARAALRARGPDRSWLAAALAGCAAFCLTAVVDWMWQIPALAVAMLLLAALLVSAEVGGGRDPVRGGLSPPWRAGFAALAALAIVAIAIPLAAGALLRQSEADARAGELGAALSAARTAQNVQSYAAAPRLQEALVLEEGGNFGLAAAAAREAIEREPTNWRNWLVLSRIEAENGQAAAAVRDYREARSLNPLSSIFDR